VITVAVRGVCAGGTGRGAAERSGQRSIRESRITGNATDVGWGARLVQTSDSWPPIRVGPGASPDPGGTAASSTSGAGIARAILRGVGNIRNVARRVHIRPTSAPAGIRVTTGPTGACRAHAYVAGGAAPSVHVAPAPAALATGAGDWNRAPAAATESVVAVTTARQGQTQDAQ
jgi:hypothetical protein